METKSFIKTKLNQLLEAKIHEHFLDRLKARLLETHEVTVGYELSGSNGQYKKVGLFQIPPEIKQRALDTYNTIVMTNFPKNQHFGIKIVDIPIPPNKVKFYDGFDINELKGKTLILVDEATSSNGNILYAIVRHNEAKTIFYAKSYIEQNAAKMNVDFIIKNIANYKPR